MLLSTGCIGPNVHEALVPWATRVCLRGRQLLWSRISGQVPSELTSYRFNPAGNSICGKAATKSPRKVLKSSPWARLYLPYSQSLIETSHPAMRPSAFLTEGWARHLDDFFSLSSFDPTLFPRAHRSSALQRLNSCAA